MGKPTVSHSPGNATPAMTNESHNSGAHPQPQDYLLQLLNRTLSPQSRASPQRQQSTQIPTTERSPLPHRPASSALPQSSSPTNRQEEDDPGARRVSPIRQFGTHESKEPTPFEPDLPSSVVHTPNEKQQENPFTYVNPFDKLAASSPLQKASSDAAPRKEKPNLAETPSLDSSRRISRHVSPAPPVYSNSHNGLNENGHDILQSIETSTPKSGSEQNINEQTLLNFGAPTTDTETVAQALNDVDDQVNRQIERALAQQEEAEDPDGESEYEQAEAEFEEQLHDAAVDMKEELERDGGGMETLQSLLPAEMAIEVKELIDEAANGNVDGHNESADDEDSSGRGDDDMEVPVYNFPIKPFVSIDLHQSEPAPLEFRQSTITDIARLKKDFDQIDRTLATASNNYIVYAMPKPGGYRVIRQDDGLDRQVFKETKDHVFNVSISNTAPGVKSSSPLETCIATAMSGKVYWTALNVAGTDNLAADNFEQHCLVFPPVPANFEIAAGGQLKTRAKKSTRHPEFFAIGRGKSIQIVFPLHAQSSTFLDKNHVVDTVGYFKDRTLKINMGKAGKDFTFSEDDTVITTLDKAGKLRFWDVRDLVNESNGIAAGLAPIEVKSPLLTFSTSIGNEKFWPTSVLFVDKLRAYQKGTALRYVIVGMKQNHTLQLWDLGLGKAVQEINFPHDKESDPICSIAYHAATSIITVGHPTRNSIYFIHLSAPKYNLQGMSQATYVERIANKDPLLQKPDSTAIMSGMREYCFSSKGQIRSIDILPMSTDNAADRDDPGLFELYVMHSKGVTCLNIRKADLGLSDDMRVISSRSAEAEGIIVMKELREAVTSTFSEPSSVNGEAISSTTGKAKKNASDPAASKPKFTSDATAQIDPTAPIESALNGAAAAASQEKSEKRKKKKISHTTTNDSLPPPAPIPPSATAAAGSSVLSPTKPRQSKESSRTNNKSSKRDMAESQAISLGVSSDFMNRELEKLHSAISAEVSANVKRELDTLGNTTKDAMAALQDAGFQKQETVLKLVQQTLASNVERSLELIINQKIDKSVIPTVHSVTASTIRKEMPDFLTKHLLAALPAQLKLSIPEAVSKALKDPGVLQFLKDQVSTRVVANIEKQINDSMQTTILPRFQSLIMDSVVKKVHEMEKQLGDNQQQADKIENLTKIVESLAAAVDNFATSQKGINDQILQKRGVAMKGKKSVASPQAGGASGTGRELPLSPEKLEINQIDAYMASGNSEQAAIQVGRFKT